MYISHCIYIYIWLYVYWNQITIVYIICQYDRVSVLHLPYKNQSTRDLFVTKRSWLCKIALPILEGIQNLQTSCGPKTLHVLDLSQFTATNEVMDSQVGATSRFSWWKTAVHAMLAAPLLPELFPRLQTPLPSEIVKFFSDLIRHTLGSII